MRCTSCQRENPDDASFCGGCGARLTPPATRAPSALAGGRYTLGRLLGEGASKRVYLGRDRRLEREVAVARIETAGLDDAGRLRIEREAQAMARLGDHPNIVTVHDVLEESGAIYIVTQYMAGGDLAQRIAAAPAGRLTAEDAIALAIQICRALEHAHARGVIHRDLKPANVWLAGDGGAKLGDFGLALALDRTRLTAEGMIVGTVAYMPPEQALGRPRDARSDLYALGATLYEMVTGRPPFTGEDVVAVLSQHIHTPVVAPGWLNPAIPQALERLILDLLAKDPDARPTGAAAVRGRLQALQATPVGSPPQAAPAPPANPLDRLAGGVFVGRSAETERLRAGFEDALSGRLRVLLVSGEPGIGKTRLAEELTTYARMRGAEVLWGRCHDGPGAPPFWPWMQVVRAWLRGREPRELLADLGPGASDLATLVSELHELLPGLAAPPRLEPEQARFRLFESATVMLRNAAQRRPLVVVLDDLHWADEASLHLLQFLVREIGAARLLLVGTYRDVELRRGHPLSETLAELTRERATARIALRGLSAGDVERFLVETSAAAPPRGLAETIHRETEGNPFFVQEVVRLLAAEGKLTRPKFELSWSTEIPQGVKEVIGRRLNKLSESCNEVLGVAAVLGREFDLPLLARVSAKPETALLEVLDEAVAARVLMEVREALGRYRFSHALVRETLYDELNAPRRVRLHRAAAEALERISGEVDGPLLAEIAHHFFQSVQAGDAERTIAACERAAEWARSRQAWEDAAVHLERAVQVLEMTERPDPERLCELVVAVAECQGLGRLTEKTRATALRGAELARTIGSPRHLARAALAYGVNSVFIEAGRVDAAMVGLLEEALAALGDADPTLRACVLHRLSNEMRFSADLSRSAALLAEAREVAKTAGDPALLARVSLGLSWGMEDERRDEAADESERLAELARQGGDAAVEQSAWAEAAAGAVWLGQVERARRAIAEMRRLAEELRTPWARYLSLRYETVLAILEGRFDEALALVRQGRQLLGDEQGTTNQDQWFGTQLYVVARQRGAVMPAEPALSYAERFPGQLIYHAFLCGVHLSAGERNEARRELGLVAAGDFGKIQRNGSWMAAVVLAAEHTCELGERRYAETLYALLRPFSGRCPGMGPMLVCLGPSDLHLGRLAALLGRHEIAVEHLRAAIDLTRRMGARPYQAESRWALARVLAERGGDDDREEAIAELDAALAAARDLGMAKLVEQVLERKLELTGVVGRGEGRTLPLEPSR